MSNQDDVEEGWVNQNAQMVDDNAVYIDYNPEQAMQKLKNIGQLSYAERKTYTQHLSELMPIIGPEVVTILHSTLKILTDDSDEIKLSLLNQIPGILKYLKTLENGYEYIRDIILHPIFDMLSNPKLEVKEEAGKKLSETAQELTSEDRGQHILRKILEMAHDDVNEDNRIVAVQLLSKLAECFGIDLCDSFVGLEFLSLGDDPQIRVRRETIINLPVISKICSKDFYKKRLLPFYQKKCLESIWGMRKACVEIIVALSEISDMKDKEECLSNILVKQFLEDQNKWVKVSAYKNLGPFIATLQNGRVNEKLFYYFTKMTEHNINYLSNNNEIMISCSYYFPAVLLVFGPNRWNDLKSTLQTLIKSKVKHIRKPIACGLHEVAKVIGQERAERDLFEVYEQVLKDPSDDVKFGAIKNLATFLSVFDSEKKESLVEVLQTVQKDPKKWRVRQLIAKQIAKLTKIYSPDIIFSYILPISTKLCNDNVAIVREQASRKMYAIVIALQDHDYQMIVIETIKAFSLSLKYSQRQVFVLICQKLMNHKEVFEQHFFDTFEQSASDKIINVRISVTQVIVKHYSKKGPFVDHPRILEIIDKLKQDECQEIKKLLTYILPEQQQQKQVNELISQQNHEVMSELQKQQQKENEANQYIQNKISQNNSNQQQNQQKEEENQSLLRAEEERLSTDSEEQEKLEQEFQEKEKEEKEKIQKEKEEEEKALQLKLQQEKEEEEKALQEKLEKEKEEQEKALQEKFKKEEEERILQLRIEQEQKEEALQLQREREEEEKQKQEEEEKLKREEEEKLKREEEEKQKREEEEKLKKEEEEKLKKEEEEKLKKEQEEKLKQEEEEKLKREEEEKLKKEEEEKLKKEQEEKLKQEEEEKLKREEEEKLKKEEEEKLKKVEEEKLKREEEEKQKREEEEKQKREEEEKQKREEEEKLKREEEEKLKREEEEKLKLEEEEKQKREEEEKLKQEEEEKQKREEEEKLKKEEEEKLKKVEEEKLKREEEEKQKKEEEEKQKREEEEKLKKEEEEKLKLEEEEKQKREEEEKLKKEQEEKLKREEEEKQKREEEEKLKKEQEEKLKREEEEKQKREEEEKQKQEEITQQDQQNENSQEITQQNEQDNSEIQNENKENNKEEDNNQQDQKTQEQQEVIQENKDENKQEKQEDQQDEKQEDKQE